MAERTADRPGSLVESHKGYDPRIIFFYFVILALFLVLVGGLAYQQLVRNSLYAEREIQQNQRRIVVPGPRGAILDREGRLLVGNRSRFAVTLNLDELRGEFWHEYIQVRKNYRELGDKDLPDKPQMEQIARYSVIQRYLDQINRSLGRNEKVDGDSLKNHYNKNLLLPYILLGDLKPEEYAELVEQLPVESPLQVYASSTRWYPYGSAAAHTLGYVVSSDEVDSEEFAGTKIRTFSVKGTLGGAGMEAKFDSQLQGESGGAIYRVSPAGYRIEPALERRVPVQGKTLTSSLDIDLQLAAEEAIGDQVGSAIALDVNTGEVLALASKPDYNLNDFSPRVSSATMASIEERKAWLNRAVQGAYPPGSTFKILVSIAGMRSGAIIPDDDVADCEGTMKIGGHLFTCDNGEARHGVIGFREAIAQSCDIFFYTYGEKTQHEVISAEAQRFNLDKPTGIELPHESRRMIIPTTEWKRKEKHEGWFPGDTANMSIGQGNVYVTPLQMACFAASVARNETVTKPTLIHNAAAPVQHSELIGLTPEQRSALLDGMEACTTHGTAKNFALPAYKIPGLRIAGKTGTAQVPGNLNVAWFICFAPIENPQIALAIAIQGDTPGENFGGGSYAVPVASSILKTWWNKKNHVPAAPAVKKTSATTE